MSDLAPGILIAVPQLDDPNFSRSVVLLIEHNESGAMGIVFNRPSDIALSEIGKEHGMEVHEGAGYAFIGGPVQRERGFLVHRRPEVPDSVHLQDDVWLSVSTDALRTLLAHDLPRTGSASAMPGWGPGQLEKEMVSGGWLNSSVSSARIFDTPPEKISESVIRDLGIDPAFLVQGGGKQ